MTEGASRLIRERRPHGRAHTGCWVTRIGVFVALMLVLLPSTGWADVAAPSAAVAPVAAAPPTWQDVTGELGLKGTDSLESTPLGNKGGFPVDFVWTVVAAILVFWMQCGFALLEAGFTRAKNAVNIFMKNLMDFVFGSLVFWAIGFGIMFGASNGVFGTTDFAMDGRGEGGTWNMAFLLFQTVFAATSATIVSGAMAERTKFQAYLVYSVFITAILYPVFGSWAWGGLFHGGGWLEAPAGGVLHKLGLPGFVDFAGSTVVHSIGGWTALAGAMALGPRLGKYDDGAVPVRGHSMALATIGVFILWMGWFGFNAGSTTGATGSGGDAYSGSGKALALIAVNTNLSGCAGAAGAMLTTWYITKKPDIGMTLNGVLAGLVGITAGCASVAPASAVAIGGIAGVLVVLSVQFFDKLKIDDPVGAISVHGACGAWGTLAVALFHHSGFSAAQLVTQAIGVTVAFAWAFGGGMALFKVLQWTVGLRVTQDEEIEGLDLGEHGAEAYPVDLTQS